MSGPDPPGAGPPRRHCLVVDDDPMIAGLMRDIFEGGGFRVSLAGSVAEAETVLGSRSIDLMAVDATLPDQDGVDWLLRRLQHAGEPSPATLVMTGALPDRETLESLRTRGIEVVEKPFGVRSILAAAQRLLDDESPRDGSARPSTDPVV